MFAKDIMPFKDFVKKQVCSAGFPDEVAENMAWDLCKVIVDRPQEAAMAPFAITQPGATFIALRSPAINSERLRHNSGISIVFDMAAFRRRFEAGER